MTPIVIDEFAVDPPATSPDYAYAASGTASHFFHSYGDAIYCFPMGFTEISDPFAIYKSTDDGQNWTRLAYGGEPDDSENAVCYADGSTVYLFYQPWGESVTYYQEFDLDTETLGSQSATSLANSIPQGVTRLSDDSFVVLFIPDSGTAYLKYVTYSTGSGWGTPVEISTGATFRGGEKWPTTVLSGDTLYLWWVANPISFPAGDFAIYHRALDTSAWTLGSITTLVSESQADFTDLDTIDGPAGACIYDSKLYYICVYEPNTAAVDETFVRVYVGDPVSSPSWSSTDMGSFCADSPAPIVEDGVIKLWYFQGEYRDVGEDVWLGFHLMYREFDGTWSDEVIKWDRISDPVWPTITNQFSYDLHIGRTAGVWHAYFDLQYTPVAGTRTHAVYWNDGVGGGGSGDGTTGFAYFGDSSGVFTQGSYGIFA